MVSKSYSSIHSALRRAMGKASDHACSAPGCTRQARNWAWLRSGPEERGMHSSGVMVSWGTDLNDYAPMCVPHAAQLDHGGDHVRCNRGHLRTPANTYRSPNAIGGATCLTCKKERRAERNALKVKATCPHCSARIHEAGLSRHVRRMHQGDTE